jgi:hypothetical protein
MKSSTRHKPAGLVSLALSALALSGMLSSLSCKPPPIDLSKGDRDYTPTDYPDVLEKWTRRDKTFEDFDVNLSVVATYWSWDFTWAYAVKYAKIYGMNEAKAREHMQRILTDKQKHHEFFLSAATQEPEWNDFADKDSVWRIVLIDDKKNQLEPSDVELVSPVTTSHRTFFPHLKLFFNGYRVRFARKKKDGTSFIDEKTRYFVLQIAGPEGKVRLKWKLRR